MYATERQRLIRESLHRDDRVVVTDLAGHLGVTTETVRRDLAQLEDAGILRRVHGGAVPAARASTAEADLGERFSAHSAEKKRIAKSAVHLLGKSFTGSVLLDAGTTVTALATEVARRATARRSATLDHIEIVTHAVAPAASLAAVPGIRLTTLGGRVRGVTGAAVGAGTVDAIHRLRPDIAFVGTNAISAGFGCSTPDPDEAAVKRAIVRAARRVVLLADSSKFGLETLEQFALAAEVDLLVTDRAPEGPLAEALTEADVEVQVA